VVSGVDVSGLPAAVPAYVEPMKARLEEKLPEGEGWLFEVKLDGIRAIAVKDAGRVLLSSRRPRDLTKDYPKIVEALQQLGPEQFVVDGEIVALDEEGRSSFQSLQNLKQSEGKQPPVYFYLFDLINLHGRDLKSLPLPQRKAALQALLEEAPGPLRLSPALSGNPAKIWKEITKLRLEGAIAKRRDSKYEPGRRSGAWLKVKAQNEQEFVIGGYTQPHGSREHFGAILVGYYEKQQLIFAGKVGTGFTTASLQAIYRRFQPLRRANCRFVNLPTRRQGRYGQGITATEMKRCVWLKPELVCEVKFLEWTREGNLRQPVFLGFREDRKPHDVARESPAR
jgi:bifunctional non-homologous end joining protein LigD